MNETIAKVLVIDDNPHNLDVLAELLDREHFIVLFALDGLSGIERATSGQPDLILLDVMMPDMDGFETCRRLKANPCTQRIPVIFMTALAKTTDKVTGFELGAVDYITKPIQPAEVLARIHTHLKMQRLQQDLLQKNEELRAAYQREQDLNKLKSRFISVASHELRSPLAAIQITASALKRYSDRMPPDKKLSSLERIERSVQKMTGLLNDVLLLAKVEANTFEFKPELTDVGQLCQEIADELKLISEDTHPIVFSGIGDHAPAVVDRKLLRHILSNLLSNAVKYSPAGSPILFEFTQTPEALTFQVADQGIGISADDQRRLFDAFQRGTNVGEVDGVGLGLSIVKQFVELHGGTISVESEVQKGTRFTVTIPIHN